MTEFRLSKPEQIPLLRQLWMDAFGDDGTFLDLFFSTAYAPHRCMTALSDGKLVSALYWFDCSVNGKKVAYVYAVGTFGEYYGKGYASALMRKLHSHLAESGYSGAVLSPGEDSLYQFYSRLGYRTCCHLDTHYASPAAPIPMEQITPAEYCRLRADLCPENYISYSESVYPFLDAMTLLYRGEDFLCAVSKSEPTTILELLGRTAAAEGIAAALAGRNISYRTPGTEDPYAMALAFPGHSLPEEMYLGFAFE